MRTPWPLVVPLMVAIPAAFGERALLFVGAYVTIQVGRHTFLAPWPLGTTVEAKTGGATDADGRKVRWLVGRVNTNGKSYYFVSCVIGGAGLEDNAGIDLAAKGLHAAGVL